MSFPKDQRAFILKGSGFVAIGQRMVCEQLNRKYLLTRVIVVQQGKTFKWLL